ncbi:hypothetical protein [Roseovarius sp. A-2]|nr:hypothetical protein [Roseovarius sp. A-2]
MAVTTPPPFAAGTCFSESHSWDLPDWFASPPEEANVERYSWGRQNWFD